MMEVAHNPCDISVQRVLHKNNIQPYHFQLHQELPDDDFNR